MDKRREFAEMGHGHAAVICNEKRVSGTVAWCELSVGDHRCRSARIYVLGRVASPSPGETGLENGATTCPSNQSLSVAPWEGWFHVESQGRAAKKLPEGMNL